MGTAVRVHWKWKLKFKNIVTRSHWSTVLRSMQEGSCVRPSVCCVFHLRYYRTGRAIEVPVCRPGCCGSCKLPILNSVRCRVPPWFSIQTMYFSFGNKVCKAWQSYVFLCRSRRDLGTTILCAMIALLQVYQDTSIILCSCSIIAELMFSDEAFSL
jgi:hypothetical protein